MPYDYFVSYARNDDNEYLKLFLDKLGERVGRIVGHAA
jgi:hypothetical protein